MASDNSSDYDDDLYDDDEDTQKDMYLTFDLDGEGYGVEIGHVTEIIGVQRITEVPDMPPFIKGVINLRGTVIPTMDVRLRFNLEERDHDERTCIIVVELDDVTVGLLVDQVKEVISIPEAQVAQPPKVRNGPGVQFIKGLGRLEDEVKIILDVSRLLYSEEMEQMAALADSGE